MLSRMNDPERMRRYEELARRGQVITLWLFGWLGVVVGVIMLAAAIERLIGGDTAGALILGVGSLFPLLVGGARLLFARAMQDDAPRRERPP